jgi:SAM-dependent methyltransferase
MRRWLAPLKPVLLPPYNAAHRLAWRAGTYAGAVVRGRVARCDVCGCVAPMLHRRWVIGPELERRWALSAAQAEALAHKETDACAVCGAKLRVRRLARALLDLHPDGGTPARSVREWIRTGTARALAIAEINRIEGLHEQLARLPGLVASDFHDPEAPGTYDATLPHEDLRALSYPDAAFDIVLHSETLEHVPDLETALGEIRRILKPGGWQLFTVPVHPGVTTTHPRARLEADGTITALERPLIRHPGGDWGYPVFHELGTDLAQVLCAAGFDRVEVLHAPPRDDDLAQVYQARRPA